MKQGKTTLRIDKVKQVLWLFGHELGPIPVDRNQFLDEER
jgi:hypothetical protein